MPRSVSYSCEEIDTMEAVLFMLGEVWKWPVIPSSPEQFVVQGRNVDIFLAQPCRRSRRVPLDIFPRIWLGGVGRTMGGVASKEPKSALRMESTEPPFLFRRVIIPSRISFLVTHCASSSSIPLVVMTPRVESIIPNLFCWRTESLAGPYGLKPSAIPGRKSEVSFGRLLPGIILDGLCGEPKLKPGVLSGDVVLPYVSLSS